MFTQSSFKLFIYFFFSSRRRHTRLQGDWSSDVCSSDLSTTATTASSVAGSPYPITVVNAGTLSAANYDFPLANFVNGGLTINKRDATWTTTDSSKTYGDADPSPLTTGSGSNFVASDGVSATYSRASGETAGGLYPITATLSATVPAALNNYNITNAGAAGTVA